MLRAVALAALVLVASAAVGGQPLSVLHIKIALTDADRKTTPVPHHTLLISDNPTSAPPRVISTALDGTADVKLQPGNYTVESDRPVVFQGKSYQWTRIIDVVAGRDQVLELTADNADADSVGSANAGSATSLDADPSFLFSRWRDSVLALWTPSAHASGFVVDSRGLVATNERVIGAANSVEVQLSSSLKVAGRVLATDSARNAAVVWIDPSVIGTVKAMALTCAAERSVADQEQILTIGVPLGQPKDVTTGTMSNLVLPTGSEGGPVLTADGSVIGITSRMDKSDDSASGGSEIVRAPDACEVIRSAEKKMANASPPSAMHLPVEPDWPLPLDAFKQAAQRRAGSMNPYRTSTSAFDVDFITPVMIYGAQYQSEALSRRARSRDSRTIERDPLLVRPLTDFGAWSDYVERLPPVLLVRITPKQVESFWTTVARGAAQTQGVAVPRLTHVKTGFSAMRAYCDDLEITPIHSFAIEQRIAAGAAVNEGLYVFEPAAFRPTCATVKIVLYGEKDPQRGETHVVEPRIVQQISKDFALYPAR